MLKTTLPQTEDHAEPHNCLLKTGHGEINMKKQERKWSKGMFAIFELPESSPILTLDEIMAKYIHHQDKLLFSTYMEQLKNGKIPPQFRFRIIVNNKMKFIVSSACNDAIGKNIYSISGYLSDMTEWLALENKHKIITEQAAEAIITANAQGAIIDTNKKGVLLTGYSYQEILKKNVLSFFSEKVLREKPFSFGTLKEGQIIKVERDLTRKDGSTIPIEMTSTKLSDGRFLSIARDISYRLKQEAAKKAKIQKIKDDLDKANRMLVVQTLENYAKGGVFSELKKTIKNDAVSDNLKLAKINQIVNQNINKEKTSPFFRLLFEEVHPGFFCRLDKYSGELTPGDKRLAACLRMNMTSKEISIIAGTSLVAVNKSRNRLRKRLNLQNGENLIKFMQKI